MWAAIFPGQGSQTVGMGRFLFDEFQIAKQTFEEASDSLHLNFKELCFNGPEDQLQLTENTQPALLLVSTVAFRVIQQTLGLQVTAAAGHSIGEYAAMVTANAIKFSDALLAVRRRGQAMQKAVPVGEGAMVAVMGLTEPQVVKLCAWAEQETGLNPVEPANFNAPGQIVISGNKELCDWLRANAKPELFSPDSVRMKFIALNVSAPFHCRLMQPAEDEMRKVLQAIEFMPAAWPVVQNFTAIDSCEPKTLRENLIRQVSGPVRWTQCMARLKELGCSRMIEFGPGKVLSGLAKKIDSEGAQAFNINSLEDLKTLENQMA